MGPLSINDGTYTVTFNRDITGCVLLASPSSRDSTNAESVTAGAAYGGTNTALVLLREDFADTREDADFALAAFC